MAVTAQQLLHVNLKPFTCGPASLLNPGRITIVNYRKPHTHTHERTHVHTHTHTHARAHAPPPPTHTHKWTHTYRWGDIIIVTELKLMTSALISYLKFTLCCASKDPTTDRRTENNRWNMDGSSVLLPKKEEIKIIPDTMGKKKKKGIVCEVARGDKHYLRKSADHKSVSY